MICRICAALHRLYCHVIGYDAIRRKQAKINVSVFRRSRIVVVSQFVI